MSEISGHSLAIAELLLSYRPISPVRGRGCLKFLGVVVEDLNIAARMDIGHAAVPHSTSLHSAAPYTKSRLKVQQMSATWWIRWAAERIRLNGRTGVIGAGDVSRLGVDIQWWCGSH
jgi:hypothetical protein